MENFSNSFIRKVAIEKLYPYQIFISLNLLCYFVYSFSSTKSFNMSFLHTHVNINPNYCSF